MTKQEIILNELLKHNYEYEYYGIRTDNREYQVGDTVANSHAWDFENDREIEDEFYNGACATGIAPLWFDEDDMEAIEKALEIQKDYRGAHQYLIAGGNADYGNDRGEIIIENAEVIAILA